MIIHTLQCQEMHPLPTSQTTSFTTIPVPWRADAHGLPWTVAFKTASATEAMQVSAGVESSPEV